MKLLLYCTKANKYERLVRDEHYGKPFYLCGAITENFESLNGKIVAECDYEVEEITIGRTYGFNPNTCIISTENLQPIELLSKSCFKGFDDLYEYLKYDFNSDYGQHKGAYGYAIHIKNLHIFDEPKELQEYATLKKYPGGYEKFVSVERAPQNMQYVYDVNSENPNEKKVLISIKPEWLCKILNKEKTIEVRRVVLKEMLNNE
jgi:predicted transcriptional regulator